MTSTSYKTMEQPWAPTWPPPMPTSLWADLNNHSWLMPEKSQQFGGETLMKYSPSEIMKRKVLTGLLEKLTSTPHHQIHNRMVQRQCVLLGQNCKGGRAVTDLYVKPTDTRQHLAVNSCHPRHCKEAIPYSQALRMRQICSSDEAFNTRNTKLKEHLTCRAYEKATLQQQINRPNTSTKQILSDHQKRNNKQKNSTGGIIPPKSPTPDSPDTGEDTSSPASNRLK